MNYGRFENNGRDYVITNPETPSPWINYLFGDKLSAFVSQAAGGMLWYEQPYYGRITRYRFNGLPMDSPGFILYINDGDQWWNPSFFPTTTTLDEYECRHSPGKTTFSALKNDIRCDLSLFITDDALARIAETMLGNNERAFEYFSSILPSKRNKNNPELYANEPYAFSSWVYGPDHDLFGKGQLSWLTGGAAWMYTVGMEYILGVKPTLKKLELKPCLPAKWESCAIERKWRGENLKIEIKKEANGKHVARINGNAQ